MRMPAGYNMFISTFLHVSNDYTLNGRSKVRKFENDMSDANYKLLETYPVLLMYMNYINQ